MHWPFRQRSNTYLQSSEHRSQAEEVRKEAKMLTAVPSTRREVDKMKGMAGGKLLRITICIDCRPHSHPAGLNA